MNFRRGSDRRNEPEINLVPLIDVMLVIIIFLMMTTTFSKIGGLEISLPTAGAKPGQLVSAEIIVGVTALGDVSINGRTVPGKSVDSIAAALAAVRPKDGPEPVVLINADAQASHQSVVNVMQASQDAGLARVTFEVQQERKR